MTSIILPARNDDFAVQATSRSYYEELILAGVRIHEFLPGLLHTKSITLDNEISLIGSANMDRRSFDLNYENNILLHDKAITLQMRERQQYYIDNSRVITLDDVRSWSVSRRLLNNAVAIVSPLI
ncbi:Cardiolipin synthase A [compost metagenome]